MTEKQGSGATGLLVAILACLLVAGAAWWYWSGPPEGQVSGTVTFEQAPVPEAQVTFACEDPPGLAPVIAPTDDAGRYRLVGNRAGGVPPGKYKVTVTKMGMKGDKAMPQGEALLQARDTNQLVNVLPKVYEDVATTPLTVDVRPGNNAVDLTLKRP